MNHKTLLVVAACLCAAVVTSQDPPVQPARPAVAKVALHGVYLDLPEAGLSLTTLMAGGGEPPKAFYEVVAKLAGLAKGDAKSPVLVDLSGELVLNQPQLSELERAFARVRASGRRIYAYLEQGDFVRYQVAALCDKVLLAELGTLDFKSPSLTVTFLKDALDLLGVQMDVVRCGEFKGAVEPFMLSTMSEHLRAHYRAMLERMNDDLVRRIAERRGLDTKEVRRLQGVRLIPAREALAAKLVDKLVPWEGAERALRAELAQQDLAFENVLAGKKKSAAFNPMAFLAEILNPKKEKPVEEDTLVVLHLSGGISDGDKPEPGAMVSGPAVKAIDAVAANDRIKGVVVRVNSPGGSATASEAIRLALARLAAKKPVVFSMGHVAGSGGYWITCIGRPILAEAGTITGSIGVFGMKPNAGPLLRRVGVHEEVVALDASASMDSLGRGFSEAERGRMQGFIDQVYELFLDHVARSRGRPQQEIAKIAGGRVWSGVQAKELGLVDEVGGIEQALARVGKEAGLPVDKVRHLPKPKSPLEALLAAFGDADEADVLLPNLLRDRAPGLVQTLAALRGSLQEGAMLRAYALMEAAYR